MSSVPSSDTTIEIELTSPNDGLLENSHVTPQDNSNVLKPPPEPLWRTKEFYFYYLVIAIIVPLMCYSAVQLSSAEVGLIESHESYNLYKGRLSNGWIFGRKVDDSDYQLKSFRNSISTLVKVMLLHLSLSHLVQWFSPAIGFNHQNTRKARFWFIFFSPRLGYSLLFSFILLCVLHGYESLKILVLVSVNYQLSKLTHRFRISPFLTWSFNITFLLLSSKVRSIPFAELSPSLQFMDQSSGILSRWHIHYNITMLRMVSFNIDHYWSAPEGPDSSPLSFPIEPETYKPISTSTKQRVLQSWPSEVYSYTNYLAYLFYPPLYLAGPIITFNDFIHQMFYKNPSVTKKGTLIYFLRLVGCVLLIEIMLHYIYVQAVAKVGNFDAFSPPQLVMIGYFNLKFVWLKLLIIWRFFRFWAMADGIDVVENMGRCMTNNYSVQGFWKGWHCSYNRWLVRYIYIPLGGARFAFLNVWVIFTFVAIWHDTGLNLLAWGWLISLFFLPEMIASRLTGSLEDKHYYRHLCVIGGALNILMLVVANLVGFALGLDGLNKLLGDLCTTQGAMFFTFVLFCLFVMVQIMKEVREEENREIHRLKLTKIT